MSKYLRCFSFFFFYQISMKLVFWNWSIYNITRYLLCLYIHKNKLRIFKNTILRQFSSNVLFFRVAGFYNDYNKKTAQGKPLQLYNNNII